MRNRPIYKKLKNFVIAQGYTIEQVENVTAQQVKNILNLTDEEWDTYKKWAKGIKWRLIEDMKIAAQEEWFTSVMTTVNQKYPQATGLVTFTDIIIQFNEVI